MVWLLFWKKILQLVILCSEKNKHSESILGFSLQSYQNLDWSPATIRQRISFNSPRKYFILIPTSKQGEALFNASNERKIALIILCRRWHCVRRKNSFTIRGRSVKVVFNGWLDVFHSTAAVSALQEENNDSIIFRMRAVDNLYDLKDFAAN